MSAATDADLVIAAITDAGEPLTLTEAGHAAVLPRWRAYKGVQFGLSAEPPTLTYARVGAQFLIDIVVVDLGAVEA